MGTGLFPGRKVDHSSPSNADVKNEWNYTSVPPPPPNMPPWRGQEEIYLFLRTETAIFNRVLKKLLFFADA
jgi:hypothetical protein